MSRTETSEISLAHSRQARGPKPSFQPALEALEERVVLSTYGSWANQAYNALRIGYAEAAYNYIYKHPNSGYAHQGYIDSYNAWLYAKAAMRTGSATYWYDAHYFANLANLDESRDRNTATTPSVYVTPAINYEYSGAAFAYNASLYAPHK